MGQRAIDHNHDALKRIVAALVVMSGLGRLIGALRSGEVAGASALQQRLRLAVLRLLRPAEAAARRLIFVMAQQISVPAPPPKPVKYRVLTMRRDPATGLLIPQYRPWEEFAGLPDHLRPEPEPYVEKAERKDAAASASGARKPPLLPAFVLFDTRRKFQPARKKKSAHGGPRITFFDALPVSPLHRLPVAPKPARPDVVDGLRLGQRLAALSAALENLHGQALRLARWQAKQDGARAQGLKHRPAPVTMRPPRCGRLKVFAPDSSPGARIREVDQVLIHLHDMALDVIDQRRHAARPTICDSS